MRRDPWQLRGIDTAEAVEGVAGTRPPPIPAVPRAKPSAEDRALRVGVELAKLDGTPPEQVEQAVGQLRSQGKGDDEITDTLVQGARRQAMQDHIARSAEARQRYQDEMQRAAAEAESETKVQFAFRAIGDIASAVRGGKTNPVSDQVQEQRGKRRKIAEDSAAKRLDLDLGQIDVERTAERDFQQGTLYDQDQADRTQGKAGAAERARLLEADLVGAGIKVPPGASARDPEGFLAFYGPRFTQATERANQLADLKSTREFTVDNREDQQDHALVLKMIDDEARKKGDALTANKQGDLVLRVEKFDRGARAQIADLDRALDVRVGGVKDIELIYQFIHGMDETAVREGEIALARAAQSIRGQIDAFVDRYRKGELVGDEFRTQVQQALLLSREQLQKDRQLFLQGQYDIASELGAVPSIQRTIQSYMDFGQGSTMPGEPPRSFAPGPGEPPPRSFAPEQQLEQLPTAAGTPGAKRKPTPAEAQAELARRRGRK